MTQTKTTVDQDSLYYMFCRAKEALVPETEMLKNDITDIYNDWKDEKISNHELIVEQVRGEVRTGKSTIVMAEMQDINHRIARLNINKSAITDMNKLVFSDETEFLRFIIKPTRNVCVAIDEKNGLASTGLNSTTELALYNYYSDVFAVEYVHRISAGTDLIIDKNTTIILDVMGKDTTNLSTRCKLIYRDIITKQMIVLGYVDISVKNLVKNWMDEGIRDILEIRGNATKQELALIELWKEKDFYIKYQVKKHRRLQLLKQHGVRDIRELEFAEVVMAVCNELDDYAKAQKVDKELINIVVDETLRKEKRVYSILARSDISQKVSALLALRTKIEKQIKMIWQAEQKGDSAKLTLLNKSISQLKQILKDRVNEQNKLSRLYNEYVRTE